MEIIIISAIWCPSCLMMKPRYKKIFNNYEDINSIFLDYDMDNDSVKEYNVEKILPVCIIKNNNKEVCRLIGEIKEEEIIKKIEEYRK